MSAAAGGERGRSLHLEVPIESDEDRRILHDAITSARAAELLKSHYVTRRGARQSGRRVPASELELPEAVKRRLVLLDRLAKALAEAPAAHEPVSDALEPGPAAD